MSERRVLVNENSLIAIGSAIREKNGTDASYKPGDMAAAILEIQTGIEPVGDITITENGEYDVVNYAKAIVDVAGGGGGDVEVPVITGDCPYRFAYGWTWAIDAFGDQMRTENITDASRMFYDLSDLKEIPFEINFKPTTSTTSGDINMTRMFGNCRKITEIPKMNNVFPGQIDNLFYHCDNIRYFPEDLSSDWKWDRIHTYSYANASNVFNYCISLRSIPSTFMENFYNVGTSSNSMYYYTFQHCYNLDEVCNLQISSATLTYNCFNSTFYYCHCLKKLTFTTNEDGTPKTANWKSQTIDLSSYVGYNQLYSNIYKRDDYCYNSGRIIDKAIYNDETYAALKNDPDSYVCGYKSENPVDYSKYNHDSAVETINSLPDTSAYGTNTIKFKGAAGAKTDAGAINTMTEEEIAVAAAKGWTVSLV